MGKKIVIIDYGMGNVGSISNMLKFIGADSFITSDLEIIEKADKIILPGVGNFDRAMNNIMGQLKSEELVKNFMRAGKAEKSHDTIYWCIVYARLHIV